MSKLNYKGQLTGSIGPVYSRLLNGQMIMQSKPGKGKMKQTGATKQAASEFGRVSRQGKHIRMGLKNILQDWTDGSMFSRFTGRLYEVVKSDYTSEKGKRHLAAGDISLLQGFEFNSASLFSDWSTMQPIVSQNDDNTLDVSLDLQSGDAAAKAYTGASGHEAVLFIAVFDKETLLPRQDQYVFKYDKSATDLNATAWQTPVLPADSLIVVTVALSYYRHDSIWGKKYLNGKDFHPCMLVGAVVL